MQATAWVSDTSAVCKMSGGVDGSMVVAMSAGGLAVSCTQSMSFDLIYASSMYGVNGGSTGGWSLTLNGAAFWISRSLNLFYFSCFCFCSHFFVWRDLIYCTELSLQAIRSVTVHNTQRTSFAVSMICSSSDMLLFFSYTGYMQTGKSDMQGMEWLSATSVVCKLAAGTAGSLVLVLTTGQITASCTNSVSFDLVSVSSVSTQYLETTGSKGTTIIGLDFGTRVWSQLGRSGQSSSLSTGWISETSISCKFASGIGESHVFSLSVGSLVGSISEFFSYFSSSVSSISPPNLASSGLEGITTSGTYFGTSTYSISGRLGSSSIGSSSWISDTLVLCQSSAGVGNAFQVSVTAGTAYGTLFSAVSYNVPSITGAASTSQARSISGTWCAFNGNDCYCQGIVSEVGADGSFTGTYSDSSSFVSCSATMCYCFNLPFTGGQIVTVVGQDFGISDYTPTATVVASSAEFTQWLSQSSLLCALPKCTDCGVSSTSESIMVAVAAQTSSATNIGVAYSYVNGTRRRRGSQLITSSYDVQISYAFSIPESQQCPQFWQTEGIVLVPHESGMLCRLNYGNHDNIQWIIDPCKGSAKCFQVQEESINTLSILQTRLSITKFSTGPGDVLSIFSCSSSSCSSAWAKLSHSGDSISLSLVGDPVLHVTWMSDGNEDGAAGWIATWKTVFGRMFKFFADEISQEEAQAVCQELKEDNGGWDLVSINSLHEQTVVEKLSSSVPVWIGLTDKNEEGVYIWTDGSSYLPEPFVYWGPGEPDNFGEKNQTKADCTVLVLESSGWAWRTEDCQERRAFVCSKR